MGQRQNAQTFCFQENEISLAGSYLSKVTHLNVSWVLLPIGSMPLNSLLISYFRRQMLMFHNLTIEIKHKCIMINYMKNFYHITSVIYEYEHD